MLFSMLNLVVLVKILYKEDIGTGTPMEKTPEMQRLKQTQEAISTVQNPVDSLLTILPVLFQLIKRHLPHVILTALLE